MIFTEEDYKKVEAATLRGHLFNPKQREFIELMESKYIIAGPGTGKTTSLSAKIVLLLLHLIRNNITDGICIITKTNVAVDEINRILKTVGQSKMKHPHFIGTVHQFFNTYLATPYIEKVLKPKHIRFSKEKDYLPVLKKLAERSAYFKNWQDTPRNIAVQRISDSKLWFDSDNNKFDLENITNWDRFEKHHSHMFNVKWGLKKLGCFSFDDIFLFSVAAIHDVKLTSLLKKRFKYVFVDEFQDNDKSSIELINQIFNSEDNILQFIGDPNQTLDFNGEMPSIDSSRVFELNICNRFGNQIGQQLPFIVNDVNIECLENKVSLNPLLLIYKSKEKLIKNYEIIFTKYLENPTFAAESKKDSILGIQNNTIDEFVKEESGRMLVSEAKIMTKDSVTRQILNLLHEVLTNKIPEASENKFKITEWLKEHNIYNEIKKCIVRSIKANELEIDQLVNYLNQIIFEKDGQRLNRGNGVFGKITSLIKFVHNESMTTTSEEYLKFIYSTIHSVKGETHRSVLLIDSENDNNSNIHTKMLKAFYCGYEIDITEDWVERNLLYVAMSRATHLFTFAMDGEFITSDEIDMFKKKGWDVEVAE